MLHTVHVTIPLFKSKFSLPVRSHFFVHSNSASYTISRYLLERCEITAQPGLLLLRPVLAWPSSACFLSKIFRSVCIAQRQADLHPYTNIDSGAVEHFDISSYWNEGVCHCHVWLARRCVYWMCHCQPLLLMQNVLSVAITRKPCCRKETARCCSCSFQFKVRRQHSLQV